ncbi:KH domain-containing protein [Candidatus Pacearchaeota archaeon]|nr:KH domain-containing protein [Candidatus Pacearchaeota archaeon]
MRTIFSEKASKILRNKKDIEDTIEVKMSIRGKDITLDGTPENEYLAEKVIDAISFGFPISVALLIKQEDFLFEIINIKDYTPRKDFETIRARIIGRGGKTLKTLSDLTECNFEINDNDVGIIGSPELIENAQKAVISIIQGSKQSNVYSFLEKHHIKPVFDLGLKEKKRKYKKSKE